jgi:DNA-binding NtrC family response regulator
VAGDQSHVLIVEDDPQGRLLLERILETEGDYEVTAAASVAEARRHLLNREYAAVLIDICLPGQSGIELLEYVHAEHIDTAAIMVTGADDRHLIDEAFASGAFGYVVKPYRVGELLISLSTPFTAGSSRCTTGPISASLKKRLWIEPGRCAIRWLPSEGRCSPPSPSRR